MEVGSENVEDEEIVRSQNVEDELQVGNQNVENEVQVVSESVDPDYIGSEDNLDSANDTEYELSNEIDDMDWTTVLPSDKLVDKLKFFDVDDKFDVLHTPLGNDDEEEHARFPAYKSGEVFKFQLGMMFNNKEMVKDDLKEYLMELEENIALKKNDGKRMVVKCMDGCEFYMRISKRVGN